MQDSFNNFKTRGKGSWVDLVYILLCAVASLLQSSNRLETYARCLRKLENLEKLEKGSFLKIWLEKLKKSTVAAIKSWKSWIFKNFEIETFFHLIVKSNPPICFVFFNSIYLFCFLNLRISNKSSIKNQKYFVDDCLKDPLFKDWLKKDDTSTKRERCTVCQKTFELSSAGWSVVVDHGKNQKHNDSSKKVFNSFKKPLPVKQTVLSHVI